MDVTARPSLLRQRLWFAWFLLAAFVVSLVIGDFLIGNDRDALKRTQVGHDFIAFYMAGDLVRHGQADKLYDLDFTKKYDRILSDREGLELGDAFASFCNPPFYAWCFVPLASLPFQEAVAIWTLISIACFIAAVALLCRMIPARRSDDNEKSHRDWRDWALVPAVLCVSLPFIQTLMHGQNAFASLLLATLLVTAWRRGHGIAAGAFAGLLFYKPQLAAILSAVLVVNLGLRAFAGVCLTGGGLLLTNLITLPGTLADYFYRLGPNVQATLSQHAYLWQRHVTFLAFWQLLLNARGNGVISSLVMGLTLLCCAPVILGLLFCIWRNRQALSRDRLIAATIAAMPLLMPYYLDYDLILLTIPGVLIAAERVSVVSIETKSSDVWLIRLWITLYVMLIFNQAVIHFAHMTPVVPILAAIATLLMVRASDSTRNSELKSSSTLSAISDARGKSPWQPVAA